ncbi:hypothetical protein RU06_17000 [Curtobacterium flaccumfaciens]|nr:hypothetical protein RU06_17000 [Curtobacterium flaccumfaciens]
MQGRGEMRLKVLLTTLMMATAPPHNVKARPVELAGMLGLRDPSNAGVRRVNDAFKSLEALGMVRRDRKPGYVSNTAILSPDGSGGEWDDTKLEPGYITLPIGLWKRGWIAPLSGRAIALLILLREATGGRKDNKGWIPGIRKRQYGLSEDFWADATTDLVDAGLLDVEAKTFKAQGEPRRRNLYHLHHQRLDQFDPGGAPIGVYDGI